MDTKAHCARNAFVLGIAHAMGKGVMIDRDSRNFKTSLVAVAAQIPLGTLRAYFSRGHFRIIGYKAEGEGLPNLFSVREAMTFAVAARLIDTAGVHPKDAFNIAVRDFAHTGDDRRKPGSLFDIREYGETLLVYWPDEGNAMLIPADEVTSTKAILGNNQAEKEAATVIVLNYLERRVLAALGVEEATA